MHRHRTIKYFLILWIFALYVRRQLSPTPPKVFRWKRFHGLQHLDTHARRFDQFLDENHIGNDSDEINLDFDGQLTLTIQRKVNEQRILYQNELKQMRNQPERQRGCQQSCCWSEKRMPPRYSGEAHRRPSLLDRLSHIDFKLLADVHFGNLRVPVGIELSKLTVDILPCLQNGTIIFVDTADLQRFLLELHEKITVHYILITGDSDLSCPRFLGSLHSRLLDQIFAGQTRIVHWFAMNCDLGDNAVWRTSTIFTCLPQGVSQWFDYRYYLHLASGKDDSVSNRVLKTDDYWVLTSFNTSHGTQDRQSLWELACHGRLKHITRCFFQRHIMNQWEFYLHIARSKFVFSPPGDGIDCYRTWEALYLGSIPILVHTSIDSIYEGLPVLIVQRYEDVTLPFLQKAYENITQQQYDYRRLYLGYWQQRIQSFRHRSESIQFQYTTDLGNFFLNSSDSLR